MIDINDQKTLAAVGLADFMAKIDLLNERETAELLDWVVKQQPETLTVAEKKFLMAAETFIHEYVEEMGE